MNRTENGIITASRRDVLRYALGAAGAAVLGGAAIEQARAEEAVKSVKEQDALAYPDLVQADPSREQVFPDVAKGDRRPLAGYDQSFENADYFQTGHGDIDVPQFHFRVMTAGSIKVDQLGIDLTSDDDTGALAIIINHFGETAMFRDAEVDNGFTVAGRVWDMSQPEMVTEAGQALLDHYVFRMTGSQDGTNCGTIDACTGGVNWAVSVVGNNEPQALWTGTYTPTAAQA